MVITKPIKEQEQTSVNDLSCRHLHHHLDKQANNLSFVYDCIFRLSQMQHGEHRFEPMHAHLVVWYVSNNIVDLLRRVPACMISTRMCGSKCVHTPLVVSHGSR